LFSTGTGSESIVITVTDNECPQVLNSIDVDAQGTAPFIWLAVLAGNVSDTEIAALLAAGIVTAGNLTAFPDHFFGAPILFSRQCGSNGTNQSSIRWADAAPMVPVQTPLSVLALPLNGGAAQSTLVRVSAFGARVRAAQAGSENVREVQESFPRFPSVITAPQAAAKATPVLSYYEHE
jgi:hypothetical protein